MPTSKMDPRSIRLFPSVESGWIHWKSRGKRVRNVLKKLPRSESISLFKSKFHRREIEPGIRIFSLPYPWPYERFFGSEIHRLYQIFRSYANTDVFWCSGEKLRFWTYENHNVFGRKIRILSYHFANHMNRINWSKKHPHQQIFWFWAIRNVFGCSRGKTLIFNEFLTPKTC